MNEANTITDLSLTAIANNCKFITKLSFDKAMLLSDFAMCRLLYKLGRQLTERVESGQLQSDRSYIAVNPVALQQTEGVGYLRYTHLE